MLQVIERLNYRETLFTEGIRLFIEYCSLNIHRMQN